MASDVAGWSKDPSTQVGCVIVDPQKRVVGMGYNGFPRGTDDDPVLYKNREVKYRRIIHAEVNAVLNSIKSVEGCTAYVTAPCCSNCMGVLIQSGIRRIVTKDCSPELKARFEESFAEAIAMAKDVGVQIEVQP
jgi:dCMP deaminase